MKIIWFYNLLAVLYFLIMMLVFVVGLGYIGEVVEPALNRYFDLKL